MIHVDGMPLADIHVTLHQIQDGRHEPIAFGISGTDGTFDLRVPGGLEAVWLEPGEYCCTIESTGEVLLAWPTDYSDATRTPLRQAWQSGDERLDLNVPEPRLVP